MAATSAGLPLPVGVAPPTAPQPPPAPQVGGRSPGLILLVAAFALVLISLQSLSEVSELLLQHVDDSLLEDGTLFTAVDLRGVTDAIVHKQLLHADDDEDGEEHVHHATTTATTMVTAEDGASKPAAIDVSGKQSRPEVIKTSDEPLVLNVGFHYFKDRYNLLRPDLTIADMDAILHDAQQTWWTGAKIVLNFTNSVEEAPIFVDDKRADAHRWFLYGTKEQKKERFWKDVHQFLRKGAGRMSVSEAGAIIEKYYQFSGHPLMDWLTLPVGYKKQNTVFDVVTVRYWPWNNGGQLGSRIFFRGGACDTESLVAKRLKRNDMVPCVGWSKTAHEQKPMSVAEAGRLVSHLIGHFLGLRHPPRSKCENHDSRTPLMCTPKKESSMEFFARSRGIDPSEAAKARAAATLLLQRSGQETTTDSQGETHTGH